MKRLVPLINRDVRILLSVSLLLTVIGLVFIYSSSSVYALEKCGAAHYYLKKQAFFLLPCLAGFFFFASVPLSWWRRAAPLLFFFSVFLISLTIMSSWVVRIHGSARWLSIAGFGFQPGEVLKLFLFMYLGYLFDKKHTYLHSLFYTYTSFLCVLCGVAILLLKQPDFGSVVSIFLTSFLVFFVIELKLIHLTWTLFGVIPIAAFLVYLKPYRLRRLAIFLDPWADPKGKGFQIIQSLLAIGVGGIWGVGIGNSRQKFFYLPMQHTDFIFSILAEETGIVGAVIVILLYILWCYYGFRVVQKLRSPFAFFTSLSFIIFITLQALINLMVVSGLVPTKGLGLPFISYGGTALLVYWCMLGFIVGAVRYERYMQGDQIF